MSSLFPGYTHIVNPKLKYIYLSFDAKGNLIIKSPKVSLKHIENLLLKKTKWIQNSRAKIQNKKGRLLDFSEDNFLYYLGERYPLELKPHLPKKTGLEFDGTAFTLFYHSFDPLLFQAHIDRFYANSAREILSPLVKEWSKKMQLIPSEIKFRKTKRQWGSCSQKNIISFNTMAAKLPLNVIHYLVVHELAHIKHKHHQRSFWELVAHHLPAYKAHINELKTYF